MPNKTDRQILALYNRANKNPKYLPGIKKKIKQIKQNIAHQNWLSQ
jgi:hypothetical protein